VVQPVLNTADRLLYFIGVAGQPDAFLQDEISFLEAISSLLSTALQRHASEARLAYLAQYDILTGLANRSVVRERLAQSIVRARGGTERRGQRGGGGDAAIAVLFVDLDRFKLVNDTLGHAAGDDLLVESAQRLRDCVRQDDLVGRISGDEFAIVLNGLKHADDAGLVARKILHGLSAPFRLGTDEAFVSASIGISVFPDDSDDAETLLKQADTAMYRAKESGRNGFCFYTAEMNERSQHRLQLAGELRHALERSEFLLYYQPKISLSDGRVRGLEALLRWQHPQRGLVMPDDFIPVLEETGLIVPVGEWALGEACAQLKRWRNAGLATVPVAVNVSARQFRDPQLEGRIRECAASAGIDVAEIELEITESHLIENPVAARDALAALRAAGIRISLDDFGTGYSSLSYLTQFPLTALKIDRSFVKHATTRPEAASIVRAIVTMAQSLHFVTIAEGVEEAGQAAFLRELGCDQAQGFLFSRPLAPDAAASLLPKA
jgi:diguanylate cyclase (GGDEF)-like protein